MSISAKEFLGGGSVVSVQSETPSLNIPSKEERKGIFERIKGTLKGETTFPAKEGGIISTDPLENIARTIGNIPSSTMKIAAPVNPFNTDSPVNIGAGIVGSGKALYDIYKGQDPIEGTKNILKGFADTYLKIGESIYGGLDKAYNALLDDPKKAIADVTERLAKIGIEDPMLIPSIIYGSGKLVGGKDAISRVASPVTRGADTSLMNIAEKTVAPVIRKAGQFGDILKQSGAVQTVKDLTGRVPRFAGRVKESAKEAGIRAEKIRTSSPAVGQALKVNLPEEYINFAQAIDDPTRKASLRVLDMADAPKTIGGKANPGIVGGELAGKQYDIIEKQRKLIGKQIGETVDNLPNVNVNMTPSLGQLRSTLSENGINVVDGALDISGSTISKAQATRLQELYDVATRGGDIINAKTVHGFDRLFSQLQREARFEQLDNIFLKVNGKDVNAFRLFRDIFRNQLDNISPEMRALNKDYAKLTSLVDDIEDSIIKTPNFNATKSADAAEFAKVNLRRIFGEAQSSPAYEKIADEMDALARTLGYADASPKDIAAFAEHIRKLYPEIVPKTGFQGGIKTGVSDIIESISKVGAPNVKDQQKALRALLEHLDDKAPASGGLINKIKNTPNKQGGFVKNPAGQSNKLPTPAQKAVAEGKTVEKYILAQRKEVLEQMKDYEIEFVKSKGIDVKNLFFSKETATPKEIFNKLSPEFKKDITKKIGRPTKSTSKPILVNGKNGLEVLDGGHNLASKLKNNEPIDYFIQKTESQLTDIWNKANKQK